MARKSSRDHKPADAPRRLKKTFVLNEETARRLASFAGRYGLWESKVVDDALTSHLAGFRAFGGPAEKPESPPIRLVDAGDEPSRQSA